MTVLVRGRMFAVDTGLDGIDAPFWSRVMSGEWEPNTFLLIDTVTSPGDVVVDIGAWIGPITLYAAAAGRIVHAIEPVPANIMKVRANISANRGFSGTVTTHQVAIGLEFPGVPPSGQTVEVCWGMMCPGRDGDACCFSGGVPTSGGVARRR